MREKVRDRLYLLVFLLIAVGLLLLGRNLIRGSVVLAWGLSFAGTTTVALLLLVLYRFRAELQASRDELMRKDAELSFAMKVQQALFPKQLPQSGGLEFSAVCVPARGVGGDYYDVLQLPDGRLVFAIADISGKGISAAILMANLQALLRVIARSAPDPGEVCRQMNQHLYEVMEASRFATLFYAEWRAQDRRLVYVNAGHNPPFVLRQSGRQSLDQGGFPLGIFPHAEYKAAETCIAEGDLLVLYSDGITDAGMSSQHEFGEERLVRLVELHRDQPVPDVQSIVLNEVRQWAGSEPEDDMTLLLVRGASSRRAVAPGGEES